MPNWCNQSLRTKRNCHATHFRCLQHSFLWVMTSSSRCTLRSTTCSQVSAVNVLWQTLSERQGGSPASRHQTHRLWGVPAAQWGMAYCWPEPRVLEATQPQCRRQWWEGQFKVKELWGRVKTDLNFSLPEFTTQLHHLGQLHLVPIF